MKKLYSLVAALMAVSSVWAVAPLKSLTLPNPVQFTAEEKMAIEGLGVNPAKLKPVKELSQDEIARINSNAAKSPAKATVSSDYVSMGNCRAINPIMSAFGLTEVMDIDLYASASEAGKFIIDNPMKNTAYTSLFTPYDNTLSIDATDADMVYCDACGAATFIGNYASYGTVSLMSYVYYYTNYAGYTVEDLKADSSASFMFGTYKDGYITLPAGSLGLIFGGYFYTIDEDFVIAFPGNDLYYTYLSASTTYLTDTNSLQVYACFDGDIKTAKMMVLSGYYEPGDEDLYKAVAASENAQTLSATSGYTFNKSTVGNSTNHLPLTVILAGLDADGNYVQGNVLQLFYQPDESANWNTIGTSCMYTDGIYRDVIDSMTALNSFAFVEVQEHKNYPGYLRIVNPYKGMTALTDEEYVDTDNDYYMYIVAMSGYPFCIEPSASGVAFGDGIGIVSSMSYDDFSAYATDNTYVPNAETAAIYNEKTNSISFPANTLLLGFPYYNEGALMQVNSEGLFSIALPDDYKVSAGVNNIAVDSNNGEAEYFNLQGVRIANPTPGQLVIRRQGGTSTKVLVK